MAYQNKTIQNRITGQTIRFIHTAQDTGGQLLEMEALFQPQTVEPAPHYHPRQEENFKILSGELTVRIDGQVKTFRPGDELHIPPKTVHSMWNQSSQRTIVNWQVQPALDTEFFLETATGLANDGKVNAAGRPPLLQVALLANRFSDVFRLEKPSRSVQKVLFLLLTPLAYLNGYRPTYKKYLN
ncbi:cupin domain-containing protein [Spirosoma taeanense]|uniref:Cupin domain-containing protein n=1 Tax=Spirosoma taeanense TaxID=2735870 RepID=A0A6M5YAQ0_9BACT|nr:cupin domain-containing protein [Spirosoma taeanense]QJW90311.1 cupin domain-containing protein [Spirosoma taeanense]